MRSTRQCVLDVEEMSKAGSTNTARTSEKEVTADGKRTCFSLLLRPRSLDRCLRVWIDHHSSQHRTGSLRWFTYANASTSANVVICPPEKY